MKWLVIAFALAGCQQVFGIKKLPDAAAIDAPPMCPAGIGHDDDGDCIGDGSDDCPGIADPAQIDSDSDKVGDVCDPDPGSSNQPVLFVAFDVGAEQNSWAATGSWTVDADDYVNADSTSTTEDWSYRVAAMYGAGNEVETRVTVGAFTPGEDVKIGLGLYMPLTATTPETEWSCSVHQPASGGPAVDAYNNGVAGSRPLQPATGFAQGAVYTVRMRFSGTTVSCDVRGDAGDNASATAQNLSPPASKAYLAVYTQEASARYHSIAIYTAK